MPFGKWEDAEALKFRQEFINTEHKNPNKAWTQAEVAKAEQDARMFGTGWLQDGKHVPADQVFVDKLGQSIEAEVGCKPEDLTGVHPAMIGVDLASGPDKCVGTFKTTDGILTLEVVGDLGLDYSSDSWMIYHLPTGAKFGKAVPAKKWTYGREPLLRWMKKVQENWAYDPYWLILAKLTPDTYKDAAQDAKDIIQNWCLSVRVE